MNARACPACAGRSSTPLGQDGAYHWVRCSSCGTIFVDRTPTTAELDAHYSGYYTSDNLNAPAVVYQRLDEVVAGFEPRRRTGRLLDVGFGAGTLLAAAERAGWECWGTEVSASALAATAETSWRIAAGDLPDLDLPPASFDVICMVEVLEHVPLPGAQLKAVLPLLRPGGLLYGTTPSGSGLSSRLLGVRWSVIGAPEHLQLFTPTSLRRACVDAGFVGARVRTSGTNPMELRSALRGSSGAVSSADRVQSGYELNSKLAASRLGRAVRTGVNAVLNATRTGDSLTFRAERPGKAARG